MLERMIGKTRRALASLLPLERSERDFLGHLRDEGIIRPDLLELEAAQRAMLAEHPALLWRATQARR